MRKPSAVNRLPMIQLEDVSVTYQGEDKPTVSHGSLTIEAGETILLIGPSGSGKSTLAMAIAGIIPRSVEGTVDGTINRCDELQQPGKIGYVFQNPESQFCMLNVADEIAFGLENLQIPREQMHNKIHHALSQVGLETSVHERHATFSGGMKQKLAVASALAMDSSFLVFDEPTANLDPLSTRLVFEQVALLRALGHTMLIIEHKYQPLLPLVDKVVEMTAEGEIAHVYTRDEFLVKSKQAPHVQAQAVDCKMGGIETGGQIVHRHEKPSLVVKNASLQYGDKVVWKNISCTVSPGEWVAILGPNGAGKSSLLEVMGGLTKPTAGQVEFGQIPLRKLSNKERYGHLAFGFQNPEYQFLYERVRDEIAGEIVTGELSAAAKERLRRFGLEDLEDASPYALSQGQKRRLAVAVMLQSHHDIYLFDEPTYGQDEKSESIMLEQLAELKSAGKAIVTITHDLNLVKQYATRVIVLAEGQILFDGSVHDLYESADVMKRAHLVDDTLPIGDNLFSQSSEADEKWAASTGELSLRNTKIIPPLQKVHPALKLLTLLSVSVLMLFAQDFTHVGRMWLVPIGVLFGLGWMNPWRVAKRLWVILLLYLVYVWSFAANSAVPAGTHTVSFLWFHVSMYGVWEGILVAIRTLSTVVLAYAFVDTTDGTDFVVSLSQTCRVTPKLSYGAMAGTGFFPRFQNELRIFRNARQVRGRDGWWISRPVTYALPMLSQAIRLGERVAIAMETRGFYGPPANHATSRTYLRRTPIKGSDIVFCVVTVLISVLLFIS